MDQESIRAIFETLDESRVSLQVLELGLDYGILLIDVGWSELNVDNRLEVVKLFLSALNVIDKASVLLSQELSQCLLLKQCERLFLLLSQRTKELL